MKFVVRLLNVGILLKVLFLTFVLWAYFLAPTNQKTNYTWAGRNEEAKESGVSENSTQQPPERDITCLTSLPANERVKRILLARLRKIRKKENELDRRERDLKVLKNEIEKRIEELKALEERLKGPLSKAKKESEERFRHLVGVYSSMEPQRAALLLEKMDEDTVVRIFSAMKSKKVAKILSFMEEEKAARISGRLSKPDIE